MEAGVGESLGCQRRHNETFVSNANAQLSDLNVDIETNDAIEAEHRRTRKHIGRCCCCCYCYYFCAVTEGSLICTLLGS